MADILPFTVQTSDQEATLLPYMPPTRYSVDVTLYPDNLMFTVHDIRTDADSLLKIADELERIARIIRTDVVVGAI